MCVFAWCAFEPSSKSIGTIFNQLRKETQSQKLCRADMRYTERNDAKTRKKDDYV